MKKSLLLLIILPLFHSCTSEDKEIYEKVRDEVESLLLERKLHSYKSIAFSPVYYSGYMGNDTLLNLIYESLNEKEKESYLKASTYEHGKSDEELIKRQISVASTVNFLNMSDRPLKKDYYKDIQYIDKLTRENKFEPLRYVVFHKFKFKDKYDEEYTEWLVFSIWSDKIKDSGIIFGEVSNEVKMLLEKK